MRWLVPVAAATAVAAVIAAVLVATHHPATAASGKVLGTGKVPGPSLRQGDTNPQVNTMSSPENADHLPGFESRRSAGALYRWLFRWTPGRIGGPHRRRR